MRSRAASTARASLSPAMLVEVSMASTRSNGRLGTQWLRKATGR